MGSVTFEENATGRPDGRAEEPFPGPVIVVSVTYGRRWQLLRQMLQSVRAEGVDGAVVVDNGSAEDIAALVATEFAGFAKVVTLGANTGSANGYKVGMETALADGAACLLMFDDDNTLLPGGLAALQRSYVEKRRSVAQDNLCVFGYRPDHQQIIGLGVPTDRRLMPPNSFFGFHLADLPFKLWRRIPWIKRSYAGRALRQSSRVVRMEAAPYSGLLLHRSVIERHGLPEASLVLYTDDTEFSYRVTASGGEVWLVTDAMIEDLEKSWGAVKPFRSTFEVCLCGEGDFRLYYSSRNRAWFDSQRLVSRPLVRRLNKAIYLGIMGVLAKRWHKEDRYRLFIEAVEDGEAQRLGVHERFPLA